MINFIKFLLIFFLMKSIDSMAFESNYANLFDKHNSPLGVSANEVRINDVAFSATHCAASENYVCVLSKVFVFSVSKDIEKISEWEHAGAHYKVLSKKEKLIRNKIIIYRLIRQDWKHNVIEYAYSTEYGVLGTKGKNGHVMMVLEKCGFAAISNAQGCQNN